MTRAPKRRRGDPETDVVTAEQAAALLGVKTSTLYAYVSRGLLRSRDSPGSRLKRYARADVVRLKDRADARKGHDAAARDALNWGAPVVESAITSIDVDGPCYRGLDPAFFWEHDTDASDPFARCAHWLVRGTHEPPAPGPTREPHPTKERAWITVMPESPFDDELVAQATAVARTIRRLARARPPTTPLACVDLVLTGWRLGGPAGVLDDEREWHKATAMLGHVCAAPVLMRDPRRLPELTGLPTRALRDALDLGDDDEDLLWRILIVMADHELNASTFAARIAAGTGATLAQSLSAALATVSGPRHGGATERVEALFDEVLASPGARGAARDGLRDRARHVVGARLARGEGVPGFGHRLYEHGDPRARVLLEFPQVKDSKDAAVAYAVAAAWQELAGTNALTHPSVDLGLVAACRALRLPPGTSTALFAIARTAGWIAHVFEQRRAAQMLRPRARYTGPPRGAHDDDDSDERNAALDAVIDNLIDPPPARQRRR